MPLRYVIAALAALALLCLAVAVSFAEEDRGAWFKGLKQPLTGGSCCDLSDCRATEAAWRDGAWWARLPDGEWIAVPPEKILAKQSIDGEAYLCSAPARVIFCFVKPTLGF